MANACFNSLFATAINASFWSDVYDNRGDAGGAMIQCTNDGGCAGICTIETRWIGAGRA